MVIAVSAWWSIGTAVIGLAGVLVGGAITWARESWAARTQNQDDVRTAARLLSDELIIIALGLEVILDAFVRSKTNEVQQRTTGDAPAFPPDGEERADAPIWLEVTKLVEGAPTNLWLEHQAPLARVLSDPEWRPIRRVYTLIAIFRNYPPEQKAPSRIAQQQKMLLELNQHVREALTVLDRHSGETESHLELIKLMRELDLNVYDPAESQ